MIAIQIQGVMLRTLSKLVFAEHNLEQTDKYRVALKCSAHLPPRATHFCGLTKSYLASLSLSLSLFTFVVVAVSKNDLVIKDFLSSTSSSSFSSSSSLRLAQSLDDGIILTLAK